MAKPPQAGFDFAGAQSLQAWEPGDWPLAPGWQAEVEGFLASDEGRRLADFLRERLAAGAVVYPPRPFRALELTPLENIHAVVLGQDPYHGPGQAEGLAFSVAPGVKLPPSLRNIFQELGVQPGSGSLVGWAQRGVLLLNTCLTVEDGQPASHARRGWEALTDRLLALVARTATPCVYLLWGTHAQAKAQLIQETAARHGREALVLQANHPSPLSARRPPAPFLGCGHFLAARAWLAARGVAPPF
ncbi:uracil-DNA glycosylase [Caenimonas sedimenti]|uniref:Uracil-DNA glycosylase n=1 Tax=Caenimonas sedimenti TaxID=2596921 RepID=A0A562ZJ22_9BURK|nr:uracil-DNA glycosylase [Caenimonas sedimenti]TWO68315.1 uracil-DNA glycosylase [Caenimonas sedimenti]